MLNYTESFKEPTPVGIAKKLTIKERIEMKRLITGELDPNTSKAQVLLNRPHIAIAFEALLEKHNLSDDRLLKRLAEIVGRKEVVSENKATGTKSSNIAAIDANAKEVIRLLWQIQGRFVEKIADVTGQLKEVDDDKLDKIIDSGIDYLRNGGKNRLGDLNGSRSAASTG
jgi:hypothetical protein